ncbi:MOSC domain-containing protein [Modestobacter marinus]|uniref:MOSC domain-containing protein n=1 Tax=Modestobacter marinus TaxID=477641 RepID=UPI0027E0944C|nr:MOSC N-terminal beta barrel domain-containing protein [Modestobacter marinus]
MSLQVVEVWRFPVKSLLGERLDTAEVGPQGVAGDRAWALFDVATGLGLTARRVPELLFAAGRLRAGGGVEVVLPDGTVTDDDDVLSGWAGRPVTLRAAADMTGPRRYESPQDAEDEERGRWNPFSGADGAFHDNADARVTLVSTETLGSWDRRRFRANVVLAGGGEDDLVGSRVRLGGAELDVVRSVPRCVMTTRPQAGGIARDTGVLKTIHRELGGALAVGALVTRPGRIEVGDALVRL